MSSAIRFVPTSTPNEQYLIRSASVFDYNATYTVRGKLYITVDTAATAVIFRIANANDPAADTHDLIQLDSTRHVVLDRQGAVQNGSQAGSTVLAVATWYDICLIGTTADMKVYIDNILDATLTKAAGARAASAFMYMADRFAGPTNPLDARLGQWRVWQSALTTGIGSENATEAASETAVKAGAWADWQTPAGITRGDDFSGNGRHWTSHGTLTDEAGPTYSGVAPPTDSVIVTVTATDPQGRTGTRNMTLSL